MLAPGRVIRLRRRAVPSTHRAAGRLGRATRGRHQLVQGGGEWRLGRLDGDAGPRQPQVGRQRVGPQQLQPRVGTRGLRHGRAGEWRLALVLFQLGSTPRPKTLGLEQSMFGTRDRCRCSSVSVLFAVWQSRQGAPVSYHIFVILCNSYLLTSHFESFI